MMLTGYVAISGEMRTMPGLPKHAVAERIDIDQDGNIVGLPSLECDASPRPKRDLRSSIT